MIRFVFSTILLCLGAIASSAQLVKVESPAFRGAYNLLLQCPTQIEWTVRRSDLGDASREPSWRFIQTIHNNLATATHDDYVRSGYDRGHLCPAADRSASVQLMRQTFVMANIAPQSPKLNRGDWKKTEIYCRNAALIYDSIHVLAIPVFLDRDTSFVGGHRLAVPHAFIKVAWLPSNDSILATWFYWNK